MLSYRLGTVNSIHWRFSQFFASAIKTLTQHYLEKKIKCIYSLLMPEYEHILGKGNESIFRKGGEEKENPKHLEHECPHMFTLDTL